MSDTSNMTISIYKTPFDLRAPYAEGSVLTAIEAKQLNQVRAENISNNFRKKVDEALKAEDADAALDAVRAEIAAYDAEYAFTSVRRSATARTPLEAECIRQARAWLVQKLKSTDFKTLKAYTDAKGAEFVEAKIEEIADSEAIVKLAKQAIKDAEKRSSTAVGIDLDAAASDEPGETEAA